MENPMDASKTLVDYMPFLLMGIPVTLEVTVLSMALALPVALVLALGRSAPHAWLRWPAGFVIELFRGSSSLVQLFWAFYVLPFFGIDLPALVAGVLVLGLNEGSYLSEVFRAGFASVPDGQREASLTLGFSPWYRFFRVTLPQALPVMIPPFGNALIVMLKFSSLVSLVTIRDLSFRANLIATSLGESAAVFGVVMVIYHALALMLSALARQLEAAVHARVGRPSKGFRLSARVNVPQWAIGAKS
jgi:polar amino acid transport system permease protein